MKFFLFLIISFSASLIASSFPKVTSLDGDWSYHAQQLTKSTHYIYQFSGNEPKMLLPKNWYKHGENHAGVMWFERSIAMKDLPIASHHFLVFTGVDYLCDIWVNDTYVGSHEGYFQTFSFDISPYLRLGNNSIKVRVNSPLENYPEHYSLHKTLLRGIFSHHDTRPGGAWSAEGQDKNSGGIWNHIYIQSYKDYKFSKLKVTPHIKKNNVDLNITFSLKRLTQKLHASFLYATSTVRYKPIIKVTLTPSNFEGKSFSKSIKFSKEQNMSLLMHLKDAKLWYTHDRGFPHLYTLTLSLGHTKISQQIGFKSLTQNKKSIYLLNNTPLYLKGTNYISSQYMSEMDTKALKTDLELMKQANINTIRVHAHIEPKRFYTLCDEMGFLIWQDYNLQWGYLDTKAFQDEAIKQAKEMVDTLYNHPSIYIWSMHNEPPWDSKWMKWKYPDYNNSINKKLDDALYTMIEKYDTHHLHKKFSSNLEHPWFGWYSGNYKDFVEPSKVPVISEYGAQAIPRLSSLKKFIPQKYLLPKRKKAKKHWEYHNYQFNWNEKNGIKLKKSIQQLIDDSQTYQANLIKYATEMLRIQKYAGTTAIFQFMFNEGWPSMNWGIVDYYRHKKKGYDALKKAFAPIILVTKQTPDNRLEFYIVNDTLKPIKETSLKVTVDTKDGYKTGYIYPVNAKADSVLKIAEIKLEKESIIDMQILIDNTIITNHYDLGLLRPKKRVKK